MTATSQARKMTSDEFFAFCHLPEMRDKRIEMDKYGRIIIMEPTGGETGNLNSEINGEVRNWNRETNTGRTFDSSTNFRLPNTAIKSPDVAWVLEERWAALPKELRKKFPPLTPDFVVEIRSETDNLSPLKDKMEEFMANGCRLGWLIDPLKKKVYIYRADGSRETIHSFEETLSGEDVWVGFKLRIADLKWE
jgi:Uma2 family endonuclease